MVVCSMFDLKFLSTLPVSRAPLVQALEFTDLVDKVRFHIELLRNSKKAIIQDAYET